jgi:hypothetical protein
MIQLGDLYRDGRGVAMSIADAPKGGRHGFHRRTESTFGAAESVKFVPCDSRLAGSKICFLSDQRPPVGGYCFAMYVAVCCWCAVIGRFECELEFARFADPSSLQMCQKLLPIVVAVQSNLPIRLMVQNDVI